MDNDNVYPTSTPHYFPHVPKEQEKTLEEEIQQTLEQLPLLKTVVKHLNEKIASTDSVKKALELAEKYEISKENALIVLDIVNQQLASERNYISSRVEKAKR